jgi:hypothetical protein
MSEVQRDEGGEEGRAKRARRPKRRFLRRRKMQRPPEPSPFGEGKAGQREPEKDRFKEGA